MASIGHLAVGLFAGRLHGGADASARPRPSLGTLLAFAALAELPDLDVVGVACGLRDTGAGGHRGASHSFVLAITLGLGGAIVAWRRGWPFLRTAVVATLAVASHGILDALGVGGRGVLLFWPLSDAPFMSPWRILPNAPRGLRDALAPRVRRPRPRAPLVLSPRGGRAQARARRARPRRRAARARRTVRRARAPVRACVAVIGLT